MKPTFPTNAAAALGLLLALAAHPCPAAHQPAAPPAPPATATTQPKPTLAAITTEANIVYATRPNPADAAKPIELKLNIAMPAAAQAKPAKPLPCIVAIHGGGWSAGKREDLDALTRTFAERGFVSATISYRFAPDNQFPAQSIDCADAVRFLRTNAARFNIDPDQIGAIGFSAGAHLAMLLAVGDPGDGLGIEPPQAGGPSAKVQAAVSIVGPVLLNTADIPPASKKIVDGLIGADPAGRDERCVKASPLTYVTKGDSPILLFEGTADPLVPASQGPLMIAAMGKAGIPGRLEVIAGAGHGWSGPELDRTLAASMEFFKKSFTVSKK